MHPVESRILSLLRPGDMIRFVLRPDAERKIRYEIEGAQAGGAPGLLEERLQLVLNALRSKGYLFSCAPEPLVPASGRKRKSKPVSFWISLRPRTMVTQKLGMPHLGFGTSSCSSLEQEILLPDLPVSPGPDLFESPASLVAQAQAIEALEIEFNPMDLPQEWSERLERLAQLHQAMVYLPDGQSLSKLFINLWLAHRSGWRLQVRALLRPSVPVPLVALEIIGREIFGCECEVGTSPGREPSLVGCLPKGWPLPAVLPKPELFEMVSAERLHNSRLPRLPATGFVAGIAEGKEIRLPTESRDRHSLFLGATGTGKSTVLKRGICHDIAQGEGVVLLDPHGDLYQAVLECIPARRRKDVFLLDPASPEKAPGFNVLDIPEGSCRKRRINFLMGELLSYFSEMWDMQVAGGPSFEMYFRNTFLLLFPEEICERERKESSLRAQKNDQLTPSFPAKTKLTLGDFTRVMLDKEFRLGLLERCTDPKVRDFWGEIATRTSGDYSLANFVPYVASKLSGLTQSGFVAELLCAPDNEFCLGQRMDRGEIILINLNKGLLGAYESRLLGTLLMTEIFSAGLQRSLRPPDQRRPVNVYVDEFQNFVSDNAASMLSEARKFGLRMNIGFQTLSQLRANRGRQDVLESVLGNVGNMILFRLGVPDAERLGPFLDPFSKKAMEELPNFHALARILTPEGPLRPLVMRTLPC